MKHLVAALFAAAASMAVAEAAVIDFVAEAASTPGGAANGWTKTYNGVTVTISASRGNPYFDDLFNGRPAGLGACVLAGGPGSSCDANTKNNSDNVGKSDSITLDFDKPYTLMNFSFTDKQHNSLNASNSTLLVNGVEWSFAALVSGSLKNIKTLTLAFGGTKPAEFYLNSVTAVPLPGAAALILSGLAGLGFVARRRRSA